MSNVREKILFDENWIFHPGDVDDRIPVDKGPIYTQSKTETMLWGPAAINYIGAPDNYSNAREVSLDAWYRVTLPHDYIISQTPKFENNNTLGFFDYHNAWYRKEFYLEENDKSKRLTLMFDGVATWATVYLNGVILKHNFCGYNSFEVDITDVARFGKQKNVLAVYVESKHHEGWWYEGAGIYRHVWLCKTDTVAVDLWGVYVVPTKREDGNWELAIETTVRNDRYADADVRVESRVLDANGNEVAHGACAGLAELRDKLVLKYSTMLEDAHLWDIDDPYIYTLVTDVYAGCELTDSYSTRFGCRTFVLDSNKGLFLNGRRVQIKGVCAHQDLGLTGKAVADNIFRYKIELIKEMGANGYRTSHYPHPEATMDALDELGFIVMDETRWFSSSDESIEQMEMLVRRDRNRPSVLFWSVGNEEPHHVTEEGRRICKAMMSRIRKLDSSRVVMTAVCHDPDFATVYDELDAIGINYNLNKYDKIHEKYPDKAIFASECCASSTTRGWYDDTVFATGYINAYDKDSADNWFLGREKTWKFLCEREWVLGGYQWIAFEHRGETTWPRLCSQAGAIDLYLQKKDAFYQNKSHWTDEPMVHLMPHWNFEGREGESIRVVAYTNCDALELYLGGKSLGRREIEKYGHGEWQVPYEKGELRVEAFRNGKLVAEDKRVTTGRAVALKMRVDNKVEKANGRDVAIVTCYCVDENGLEVPTAAPFVRFHCNTLGKILGTGSDVCDHTPVTEPQRQMRAGRIGVALMVGKSAGELKLYATAEGLRDAVLTIELK